MSSSSVRSLDLFCNDLYQFTCSYSYYLQKKHQQTASFQIFFRKYPFNGQYVIFAGLESIKDFIKNVKFNDQHEQYLRSIFPHMEDGYFKWIRQDFTEKVKFRAVKQGQIVFANQPILSYTGPFGFVQLLQTPFLNLIGFASLVATNASRMVKAVYPKKCLQFGTRRAQGPDGALSAAQYAYIGGFSATSNVQCASKLKFQCIGSMSHAFVTSFNTLDNVNEFQINGIKIKQRTLELRDKLSFKTHEGQLAAFLAFAKAFPNNFIALVDSYSTVQSGLLNTILVGKAMIEAGTKNIGIRLDSGDLGALSKQCRKLWNQYIPEHPLIIAASDDLHQQRLVKLQQQKSEIDIYAIGTNIATCKKQPALGLVCKLVQLNKVPKMKLSSTPEKATYPCLKRIYRIRQENGGMFDLITIDEEEINKGEEIVVGTVKNNIESKFKVQEVRLLNEEFDMEQKGIKEIKQYCQEKIKQLSAKIFELENPDKYNVYMSQKYLVKFHQTHKLAEIGSNVIKN